ncbi:DEAD-domain-containing protein [Leucogyrophana mollusca]|uniref:DEAD-domain-containing protein n=1 Tax=Leucogyrophana mollusca TaxID=85980 RepID=A0ACB8C1I6_9AGAM|nr:DEAD-domain-containing protein [Leucogyrophana mollusca]
MGDMDFIMTIDSDEEALPAPRKTKKNRVLDADEARLNPDFDFDLAGDPYADLLEADAQADVVKKVFKPDPISVDEIIERRKLKAVTSKRKRDHDSSDDNDSNDEGEAEDDSEGDEELAVGDHQEEDPLATSEEDSDNEGGSDSDVEGMDDDALSNSSSSSEDSEPETQAEKDRKIAFFDSDTGPADMHASFLTMNLSRPIQKALTTLGFHKPTPIQAATIPVALVGKDVVGGAVTGSGKTAAFIIPMLERLLYREKGKNAAATRCLVLVPTRELAVQCFEVGSKLASHTDIRFCLVVGGLSVKTQEVALRSRPDIIIATPGRLIDHLHNSPSFTLEALDVLVLDEADRMLSDGFADELAEIVKACPGSRQTMLFSATMTDSVDELVKMSLNKPVRLFVDPKRSTARGLVQEFVRVRAEKEAERSALLVALCKRTFKRRVIIFFRSKKLAHQMRVIFGLLDMKSEELHGDLTQEQRLKALQLFRDGMVDFLMATDLASRGLDIKGIETVINFDMPNQLAQYLHRVGRTARAGKTGRSVTLVGEGDRKMLKAAIKHSTGEDNIRHRVVPADVLPKWVKRVEELKEDIAIILQEEKEEKQIRQAEMELKKGENMIEHEKEIFSRPARTWFQSEHDKSKAAAASKQQYETGSSQVSKGKQKVDDETKVRLINVYSRYTESFVTFSQPKRDKYAGLSRKAKRRKMAIEEDKELGDSGAVNAAIRLAKKEGRPTKIGLPMNKNAKSSKRIKSSRKTRVTARTGGAFDRDLSQKTGRGEGVRAKKGDVIGGMGKKKGGGKRKSK